MSCGRGRGRDAFVVHALGDPHAAHESVAQITSRV